MPNENTPRVLEVKMVGDSWYGSVFDTKDRYMMLVVQSADEAEVVRTLIAYEVERIVAHSKTKTTMGSEDDAVARPLGRFLVSRGVLPEAHHLEWSGAWEFEIAVFMFEGGAANVYGNGGIDLF